MKCFKIIAIIAPVGCVYGAFFCYFLVPGAVLWLFLAAFVLLIPLICFSVAALIRRDLRSASILALSWLLLVTPFIDGRSSSIWLRAAGFYVKTRLTPGYQSRCNMLEFVEDGVKETAAACEAFDRVEFFDSIVYDTAGEFVLPAAQRTPEWKKAMLVVDREAPVDKDRAAYHLFGHYYAVEVNVFDLKG